MFQFRRFPAHAYFVQHALTGYGPAGFPHSEICGSMRMCRYPQLIAACHVLRRLLMPRHSPCALFSLTFRRLRSVCAPFPPPGCALWRKLHCDTTTLLSIANPLRWASQWDRRLFATFSGSQNFLLRIMQAFFRCSQNRFYPIFHKVSTIAFLLPCF